MQDRSCLEHKPKLLMCGYSAYPREIDFAEVPLSGRRGAARSCWPTSRTSPDSSSSGEHPSPFPHAHVVTTTTHKTLRGPRGGLILTDDEEISKKINRAVFPGMQGGPLMHIIAAKAVAFGEALKPEFRTYCEQVVANAKALAEALAQRGYRITSGGTDNHVMLVDLRGRDENLTGADAEQWLESAGIITNKNGVPNDPAPAARDQRAAPRLARDDDEGVHGGSDAAGRRVDRRSARGRSWRRGSTRDNRRASPRRCSLAVRGLPAARLAV